MIAYKRLCSKLTLVTHTSDHPDDSDLVSVPNGNLVDEVGEVILKGPNTIELKKLDDFSMVNIVSAAIFGDGAATVILSSDKEDQGPKILDQAMYHFYDATHMMGFKLVNTGLQMILDKSVPETISKHFPQIIHPFLARNTLIIEDIDHLIFHPGGKKIVQTVEELFGSLGR